MSLLFNSGVFCLSKTVNLIPSNRASPSSVASQMYPLFAWVCYCLGVPLRLATEGVYLAAAAFFSWCLGRRSPSWVGLLVFGACALHPMRFAVFRPADNDAAE